MLDIKVAQDLLPVVNDQHDMVALQSYAAYRISELHRQLEHTSNINEVFSLQGAIAEMRRIALLREEAIQNSRD